MVSKINQPKKKTKQQQIQQNPKHTNKQTKKLDLS